MDRIKQGDRVCVQDGNGVWYGEVTHVDPNFSQGVPGRALNIYIQPGADHPDGEGRGFEAMCSVGEGSYQRHNGRRFNPEICIEIVG